MSKIPQFSHSTPKCLAKTSRTTAMERNHIVSWCVWNFPSSSWTSQCFPRCAWLLSTNNASRPSASPRIMVNIWSVYASANTPGVPYTMHTVSTQCSYQLAPLQAPLGMAPPATLWCPLLHHHGHCPHSHEDLWYLSLLFPQAHCPKLPRTLLSAALLGELLDHTCNCTTLLWGDLTLSVTHLNWADLPLALPESPLTRLGALTLEPSLFPLLLSCSPSLTLPTDSHLRLQWLHQWSPPLSYCQPPPWRTSCPRGLPVWPHSSDLLPHHTANLLLGEQAVLGGFLFDLASVIS